MPPRTPEVPQGIREERRRQILDAALVVFARKGFHDANVSDVAAQAGVSQGTIYWYFESKGALMQELLGEAFDEVLRPLAEILGRTDLSPLERLRQSFRTSMEMVRAQSERYRLLLSMWSQPAFSSPEVAETHLLDRIYWEGIFTPFKHVIQEGMETGEIAPGDAEALTIAITALMDGLMVYSFAWPEGLVSDERLEAILLRLLQPASRGSVEG